MLPEQHEHDSFRAYSERQVEGSHYVWSEYMDLIAFFPVDAVNPSVTVWRLINDKQTNSPLLFTEKIPFQGTALAWVPDRRSLSVGDSEGNVFVYDAERQRTVELQKVHACEITCLDWIDTGVMGSSFAMRTVSPCSALPPIYPTIPTIATWADDYEYLNTSPLECHSLAHSNRLVFLSVLGKSGGVSIYAGGSIPICEFFLDSSREYVSCTLSPDGSMMAVSSSDQVEIMDTSLISLRSVEIFTIARLESRIHWLLRQLASSVDIASRAVSRVVDEYHSSFWDPLEIGGIREYFAKNFTVAKIALIEKNTIQALDYLTVVLASYTGVIVDHLLATVCALADKVEFDRVKYSVFGINVGNLIDEVTRLEKECNESIKRVQESVIEVKKAFVEIFNPLVVSLGNSDTKSTPISLSALNSSLFDLRTQTDLTGLLLSGERVEKLYVDILSCQRRAVGGRIQRLIEPIRFENIESGVAMGWTESNELRICHTTSDGNLCYGHWSIELGIQSVQFEPPEHAKWTQPKLYKDGKCFSILQHDERNMASICSTEVSGFIGGNIVSVPPTEYGFEGVLSSQQLPEWYWGQVDEFAVCAERALCSLFTRTNQRLLTLDLESGDDFPGDELDELDQSDLSDDPKSKSWIDENKFRRGKRSPELDDRESPEIGNYF
jgi:hypothetical protein